MIGYKISRCFLNQSEVRPKAIVTCSHSFSRAWRWLRVFVSSSDWFIGLSDYVVIGQSNYFGFDFMTFIWKPLYDQSINLYGNGGNIFPYNPILHGVYTFQAFVRHLLTFESLSFCTQKKRSLVPFWPNRL